MPGMCSSDLILWEEFGPGIQGVDFPPDSKRQIGKRQNVAVNFHCIITARGDAAAPVLPGAAPRDSTEPRLKAQARPAPTRHRPASGRRPGTGLWFPKPP